MAVICNPRNGSKLAYWVHRSIIFDSYLILGMLIKDVMSSIIFDSCLTLGMLIKGVTGETTPCINVLTVMRLIKGWSVNAYCTSSAPRLIDIADARQFMCDLEWGLSSYSAGGATRVISQLRDALTETNEGRYHTVIHIIKHQNKLDVLRRYLLTSTPTAPRNNSNRWQVN